jgi:hypothetical protein
MSSNTQPNTPINNSNRASNTILLLLILLKFAVPCSGKRAPDGNTGFTQRHNSELADPRIKVPQTLIGCGDRTCRLIFLGTRVCGVQAAEEAVRMEEGGVQDALLPQEQQQESAFEWPHPEIVRFVLAGVLYMLSAIVCMWFVYVYCVNSSRPRTPDATVLEAVFTGVYLAVMGLLVLSIALFVAYIACAGWTSDRTGW